jgi:hypothetical protein
MTFDRREVGVDAEEVTRAGAVFISYTEYSAHGLGLGDFSARKAASYALGLRFAYS